MSEKELPPVLALRAATHKRGTPYPEMTFDPIAEQYGRKYSSYPCYCNEDIKQRLDEHYNRNPKATEATYFWYELYKEPNKTEEA
jgi:hypothetical protein